MALLTSATRAPRLFKSGLKAASYGMLGKKGFGGTVTQITSRATGVTLDTTTNRGKMCGTITTINSSLAASTIATFVVTNKAVGATDVVLVSIKSGFATGSPVVFVSAVAEGSFSITVANVHTATACTDTLAINFVVIKSVIT